LGAQPGVTRVVFDTNTVISALLFRGALSWLVEHWHSRASIPLVSRATANELLCVLAYPKFGLSDAKIEAIAARYVPFAERVEVEDESTFALPKCRDPKDRMFLALAEAGRADVLVTGDDDLLALQGQTRFLVETPAQYRAQFV